jgi:hypothetical protein
MNVSRLQTLWDCNVAFPIQAIDLTQHCHWRADGILLADLRATILPKEKRTMPIFSFLLKRRLLQSLLGGTARGNQARRAGGLLGGSFRKAAFAGITAMLVKRMLRRKPY